MPALTAYFSATGNTAGVAAKLAASASSDLYEIRPEVGYTKDDLNWKDKNSRSSVEMKDKGSRPAIVTGDLDLTAYDTIYLGFPIWWYKAPSVINTFLEAYDFSGKKIVLFATSGISKFGDTLAELRPSAPDAVFVESVVLHGIVTAKKLKEIVKAGE